MSTNTYTSKCLIKLFIRHGKNRLLWNDRCTPLWSLILFILIVASCWLWKMTALMVFMRRLNNVPSFQNRLVGSDWTSTASVEPVVTSLAQMEFLMGWFPCSEFSTILLAMSIKEETRWITFPSSSYSKRKNKQQTKQICHYATLSMLHPELLATWSFCRLFGAMALRRIRVSGSEEKYR